MRSRSADGAVAQAIPPHAVHQVENAPALERLRDERVVHQRDIRSARRAPDRPDPKGFDVRCRTRQSRCAIAGRICSARAVNRQIHGGRGRRFFQIDLGGERALLPRLVHEAGRRIDERGCADGQEHVAGRAPGWLRRRPPRDSDSPNQTTAGRAMPPQWGHCGGRSQRHAIVAPRRRAGGTSPPADSSQIDPCSRTRLRVPAARCRSSTFCVSTVTLSPADVMGSDPIRPGGNDVVRGIGTAGGDQLAAPRVPLPDEPRIAGERLGRRQILGAILAPEAIRPAKRRHAARRRHARAGQNRESSRALMRAASVRRSCRPVIRRGGDLQVSGCLRRLLQLKRAMDGAHGAGGVALGHDERDVPLGRSLRDGDDVDAGRRRARRRRWPRCPACRASGRRPPRRSPPAARRRSPRCARASARTRARRAARVTTRGASAALMTKQMLFSDEACEIISTLACCAATTSNVLATIPGMPCMPVPLIATRMTPRIDVTALTPRADGLPSTLTRVPGMRRVEAVEDAHRDALAERRKNRLVVQDLGAVVRQLRRLAVGNLRAACAPRAPPTGSPSSRRRRRSRSTLRRRRARRRRSTPNSPTRRARASSSRRRRWRR